MEGTSVSLPLVHLYDGGPPAEGREGVPDELTVKVSIFDERVTENSKVSFRIAGRIHEVGRTQGSLPAEGKEFTVSLDEAEQGGGLENTTVELLLNNAKVQEILTPAVFPGHLYTVDFGKLRIDDCGTTCESGVCMPGKMNARLGFMP